jgi:hypothetical protein
VSSHEYKGHAIRVEARPGAARPWGVWVDGVELFGQGDRVRRRLAYGTAAAALDAGKRSVRALIAALPCAHCHHPKVEHKGETKRCVTADCTCFGFQHAGKPFEQRLERIRADASDRLSKLQPRPVEVGSAAHRLTQAVTEMLDRPAVVPNIYPCGCSRLKVNAGRCDRYKPWELP